MKKRILSVLTMVVMMFAFSITAYADVYKQDPPDPNPTRYSYTLSLSSNLSFSGHTATCKSVVRGDPNLVTKIELTQCLEEDIGGGWWYRIASWDKTFYNFIAVYTTTKSNVPSGTYHVRTIAKVYSGSNFENIAIYSVTASC